MFLLLPFNPHSQHCCRKPAWERQLCLALCAAWHPPAQTWTSAACIDHFTGVKWTFNGKLSVRWLYNATAALTTSGQSCHHTLLLTKPLWASQKPLCCLSALFPPPFLFFFFFQQGHGKDIFASPFHFLEQELLPSISHHRQGGWTGKILIFSLSFFLLYSMRSRSRWIIRNWSWVHMAWDESYWTSTMQKKLPKKRNKVKHRTGLFMFERWRKEIGKVSESSHGVTRFNSFGKHQEHLKEHGNSHPWNVIFLVNPLPYHFSITLKITRP